MSLFKQPVKPRPPLNCPFAKTPSCDSRFLMRVRPTRLASVCRPKMRDIRDMLTCRAASSKGKCFTLSVPNSRYTTAYMTIEEVF